MDDSLPSVGNKLYQELLRIDKKAGESYKGALKVLTDLDNPDRFSQSAHSLREVTNIIISRKVSIPQEIENKEALRAKLERKFVEQPESLPFPSEKETRAFIRRWGQLHEFFTNISHHGKDIAEEEFLDKLSEFETILLQFLKSVPLTLAELDLLLSTQSPTENDVKKLSELLKHPTHVRYFFERLTSVGWFDLLKEHDFFRKPALSIREGNYIAFPAWPLSKYLIAIADKKPREVMDVIKDMEETDNLGVHIDLVDCALKVPASIAKEIIPLAKKWIVLPYLSLIKERVANLCLKLSNENEVDSALGLMASLLEVKGGEERNNFRLWEYEQNLSKVVPPLLKNEPLRVIGILCDKLCKAIELRLSVRRPSDLSYVWRPAIEDHPQNPDYPDLQNLLVNAIRDNLERLGRTDKEIFRSCYGILSRYDYKVFRRIELHLMRLFPELLKDEIQTVFSERYVFEDMQLWHEYYHLLREQYSTLPQELGEEILKWIERGPDLEEFESWYAKEKGISPTQAEKEALRSRWQIRYFVCIKDIVPPEWREKWKTLLTKYAEPEHPDFHSYMETRIGGPPSPLTREEIKKMTPQEIIDYLRTWKPSKDPFSPSMESLGAILRKVVSEEPCHYIEMGQDILSVQSIYVYCFLDGLLEATKNGKYFDWEKVIRLCTDILPISEPTGIQDAEDESNYWKTVRRTVARLVEEGLRNQAHPLPFELRESIWQVIKTLLRDDEPNLSYEKKYDADYVTLSFNTVRGIAAHILIQYGLWCARCLNLSKDEDRMVPEVKEQLERMLDLEVEPTKTIRAVYGLYLANLFYLDKKWTLERISSILPEDANCRAYWRAAWEAYVIYSRFYDDIYKLIRPQYKAAVNKLSSPEISSEAKEKLSEKLMVAYIRGLEGLKEDSLIKMFFQNAPPELRGHPIWFLGVVLRDFVEIKMDEKEKETVIGRIMNLYEWRTEEAQKATSHAKKGFTEELKLYGFWFVNSHFNRTWAISQLQRTLELTEGEISFATDVVDKLQDYVEDHYLDVLEILILLIKGDNQGSLVISSKEKIEGLIESIIKEHGTQEIKSYINDIVDALTRKGYLEFAKFFIK